MPLKNALAELEKQIEVANTLPAIKRCLDSYSRLCREFTQKVATIVAETVHGFDTLSTKDKSTHVKNYITIAQNLSQKAKKINNGAKHSKASQSLLTKFFKKKEFDLNSISASEVPFELFRLKQIVTQLDAKSQDLAAKITAATENKPALRPR